MTSGVTEGGSVGFRGEHRGWACRGPVRPRRLPFAALGTCSHHATPPAAAPVVGQAVTGSAGGTAHVAPPSVVRSAAHPVPAAHTSPAAHPAANPAPPAKPVTRPRSVSTAPKPALPATAKPVVSDPPAVRPVPPGYRPVYVSGFGSIAPNSWTRTSSGSRLTFTHGTLALTIDGRQLQASPHRTLQATAAMLSRTVSGFRLEDLGSSGQAGRQNPLTYETMRFSYLVKGVRYNGVVAAFAERYLPSRTVGMVWYTGPQVRFAGAVDVFDKAVAWAYVGPPAYQP